MNGSASKKKNRKRAVTLIVLITTAVLAAVCVAVIPKIAEKQREDEKKASQLVVFSIGDRAVESITWDTDDETLTVDFDGTAWRLHDDPQAPVIQSYCLTMASTLRNFIAVREVTNVPKSAVGLEPPQRTVSVVADGETFKVYFGNETQVNGEYYVLYGDRVYVVRGYVYRAFSTDRITLTTENEDAHYFNTETE